MWCAGTPCWQELEEFSSDVRVEPSVHYGIGDCWSHRHHVAGCQGDVQSTRWSWILGIHQEINQHSIQPYVMEHRVSFWATWKHGTEHIKMFIITYNEINYFIMNTMCLKWWQLRHLVRVLLQIEVRVGPIFYFWTTSAAKLQNEISVSKKLGAIHK